MAESKFLKWQDKTGDGIPDVCDDLLPPVQTDPCTVCQPVPGALLPDWKLRNVDNPFLNERECLYQITVVTNLTTTGASETSNETAAKEALQEIYTLHASDAMGGLLLFYNKKDNQDSRDLLLQGLYPDDYYLEARPNSKLKLLYSVPVAVLKALPEADASDELDPTKDTEDADETASVHQVTYDTTELFDKIMTVRKGLGLYDRYFKVSRFLKGTNIFFEESNKVFNLEDYGDRGFGSSIMGDILPQLESFLNTKNIKIPGIGWPGFQDAATKITFYFDKKYSIRRLDVYTEGCGPDQPVIYKHSVSLLRNQSSFKNPTAMAYFTHLDAMIRDLTARSPMPWLTFLSTHTHPAIYIRDGSTIEATTTAGNCIANALKKEGKQLGQDLLDETFGLADAIAYKFHENVCYKDQKAVLDEGRDMGFFTVTDPNNPDFKENLFALAQERAFGEIQKSNAGLCARIGGFADGDAPRGTSSKTLDEMWEEVVQDIKVCGLSDLMMQAIQCLFKGMSFEDALSQMIGAALKAMPIKDFGQLFILLPPEKQQELSALVQQKINSGDIFKEGTMAQVASDQAAGALNWNAQDPTSGQALPWNDDAFLKHDENPSGTAANMKASQRTRRTLVQTLDFASAKNRNVLSQNIVMEAYISALLEVYNGYYLELLDLMNKFPGAEIIAKVIATLDCPRPPPPGKDPTGYDFIKNDLELPYCFNIDDITLPRLENPFGWLPAKKDFVGLLMQAAKAAIQEAIMKAMVQLFLKICQTAGTTACKALELVGDLAQAPFSEDTLKELVKETFCGADSNDETVNEALVELIAKLGPGAVALADQQQALRFASDLSSATTRREFTQAFIGNPPDSLMEVVANLIESDYPDYGVGLKTKKDIEAFFKNIGNAMPLGMREQMKDYANGLGADGDFPANPNLCATPEQLEQFCDIRASLLGDRASDDQKAHMCLPPPLDLADVLQQGPSQYLGGSLPPILSDPGCDNGLLPFEPAEAADTATSVLNENLEMLKLDFLTDMLGNGPFFESQWGMLNLILSDTRGNPLSTHNRKKAWDLGWQQNYVDFYVESNGNFWDAYAAPNSQRGTYPINVAEWLRLQLEGMNIQMDLNNNFQATKIESSVTFKQKGFDGWFGNVNLLSLPDFGYNIKTEVDFGNEKINFIALARKKTPDTIVKYRDNNTGEYGRGAGSGKWKYGIDFEVYYADLEEDEEGIHNRPDDNMRIKIYEVTKQIDLSVLKMAKFAGSDHATALLENSPFPTIENKELKYEFLSVDDTLDHIDLSAYPDLLQTFEIQSIASPPIALLGEMLEKHNNSFDYNVLTAFYNETQNDIFTALASTIGNNKAAFDYGASLDNLSSDDLTYVIDSGQIDGASGGTPYDEVEITDPDSLLGTRKLRNSDQILGISEYQWKVKQGEPGYDSNRVFYLSPDQFGGSYKSPPLYIAPPLDKGWFGLLNVLFPEQGACKPTRTDLVNFEDIQAQISKTYDYIPEDERLKIDPDCRLELPYNRILERPAVAGLEGIITAAIRIYASMHFVKSLATFTTIKPDFSTNFSSAYASYIIEDMEEGFKDAQHGAAEFFTLFKDEEFWYAFLEQAVQLYSRRVDGRQIQGDEQVGGSDILDPPPNVLNALYTINDMQEEYNFPTRANLKAAKSNNDAGEFQTLRGYREDKNLEAIKATEEEAKLILKELVKEQLQIMGEKLIENLGAIELNPSIHDLGYYILENLSNGSSLTIDGKEIKEEMKRLPTEGEELYTNGGELVTSEGENYTGYYHAHTDEDGNIIYMEGEFHVEETHGVLTPLAAEIIVPIGDVYEYNTIGSTARPFTIQKYISIKGVKYSPTEAAAIIAQNSPEDNISQVYPGTLKQVTDAGGRVIGLEGQLGVRYGLEFSAQIGDIKAPIATTEIDVLDLPIERFETLSGDSKILLCLINQLKETDEFKLVYKYIFSLPKIAAILAIYNDMSFLPSIGEITVPMVQTENSIWPPTNLPGKYINNIEESDLNDGAVGWNPRYRRSGDSFTLAWDEWDQVLMRNSKSRIKRIFKTYYNSGGGIKSTLESLKNRDRASWTWARNLKSRLRPATGADLLPWWKKRKLRSNPFDAKGNLCEKK